jgi:prepilin-type N-terminal cleavage/methylation domain-containing protein
MNKFNRGFTLFELLVSISIIGILVALVSFSFSAAQKKARDSRRMQDMKSAQVAAEQFYAQNNYQYPGTTAPWVVGTGQTILDVFPRDPKNVGWTAYSATNIGTSAAYCFCAAVENAGTGNASDNGCTLVASGNYFCVKNQQ